MAKVPFPDAAVGFILENLKEFVQYNAELIGGVRENVKGLCDDLDTLKAFIREYTERNNNNNNNNEILETLANEIRNVVYQAEDAVETYIVSESKQKGRRPIGRAIHFADYVSDLRSAGRLIENVSRKVKDIYQIKAPLGLAALQIGESGRRITKKKVKMNGSSLFFLFFF